jgi:hypothetical protein
MGLVFANAKSLRFAACRGRLGFFEALQEVVAPLAVKDWRNGLCTTKNTH